MCMFLPACLHAAQDEFFLFLVAIITPKLLFTGQKTLFILRFSLVGFGKIKLFADLRGRACRGFFTLLLTTTDPIH